MPEPEVRATPTGKHGERRLSRLAEPALALRLREVYGAGVDDWLDLLPEHVEALSSDWGLANVRRVDSAYVGVSIVLQAESAGGDVVLKLVPPGRDGQAREAAALAGWNGGGAVRLLEQDAERGALLLHRLAPGTTLDANDATDDEATRVLAEVASRLAVPASPEVAGRLPGLDSWAEDLASYARTYGSDGPIEADLVRAARSMIDELLDSSPEAVLLHGDLHHDNVLRAGDEWVAIDPQGYVGDPASEPGQMFLNPMPYVRPLGAGALRTVLERRLAAWARFSELHPWRVHRWAFVKAVVCEAWSVEDEGQIDGLPTRIARTLQQGLGASPR